MSQTTDDNRVIAPVPRVTIHAFCETRRRRPKSSGSFPGTGGCRTPISGRPGRRRRGRGDLPDQPTPNVIIIESRADRASLARRSSTTSPSSATPAPRSSSSATSTTSCSTASSSRRGVSDYLIAPFEPLDFIQAISDLFNAPGAKPLGRTIAVVGAKGGVGASTVAHNIAWAIARDSTRPTVIADLDLALRHRRPGLQPGPAAGHRRGGVRSRPARRNAGRSPVVEMRRQSAACSPPRRCSTGPSTSTRRPSTR